MKKCFIDRIKKNVKTTVHDDNMTRVKSVFQVFDGDNKQIMMNRLVRITK